MVRIEKLELSTTTSKSSFVDLGSVVDTNDSCQKYSSDEGRQLFDERLTNDNAMSHDTLQNMNTVTDDVNSETSEDHYLVVVDECDDVDVSTIKASTPSPSSRDITDITEKTHSHEDAAEQLLSCEGASTSQNNMQRINTIQQNQPFVKLKTLDPAEIKRLTAAASRVPDKGHIAKNRYVV